MRFEGYTSQAIEKVRMQRPTGLFAVVFWVGASGLRVSSTKLQRSSFGQMVANSSGRYVVLLGVIWYPKAS